MKEVKTPDDDYEYAARSSSRTGRLLESQADSCFLSASCSSCRLAAAQTELDAVMATLREKQDSLAAVEGKVRKFTPPLTKLLRAH